MHAIAVCRETSARYKEARLGSLSKLASLIDEAETAAAQGCGQSDVLYEKRIQAAYQRILDQAPEAERSATETALKERGFDPDFVPYEAQEGECSLTGIDEYCCPCGQHP